jgi:Domain of unknown function (DUF1835)
MLHITNGDTAADVIRRAGVQGDVLPWRDVLHEGPVPQGLSLEELRGVRAGFIAAAGWASFDDALADFGERDRVLRESLAQDEVVLWFEHDLYDQLQLFQVLDWFAAQDGRASRLSLICNAEYLGSSTSEQLRHRFPGRQAVSASHLNLGRQAWAAFRSPDPTALIELLHQDTSALPFLGPALRRHLQQFPSVTNGLSRSEVQALEVIAGGVTRLRDVYRASHHEREEAIFLGDSIFGLYMEALSRERTPLVVGRDDRVLALPRGAVDAGSFWNSHARLTEMGRAVVEGRADRVNVNGIDRWLGGVHLHGPDARWRWNDAAQRREEGRVDSRSLER